MPSRRRKRTEVLNDDKKVIEMANRVFTVMQKRIENVEEVNRIEHKVK